MKLKLLFIVFVLLILQACTSTKTATVDNNKSAIVSELSSITNKTPYDPRPGMQKLRDDNEVITNEKVTLKEPMHFLVFGDSKGSEYLKDVLKIADVQKPQFCITTADLVNRGAGMVGEEYYKELDTEAGWFFRKYPTWPTLGNHEVSGPKSNSGEENYISGVMNFSDFFGLKDPLYSFEYGNAKFIALDWIKVSKSPKRMEWLEKELEDAKSKKQLIFIFKHRPYYTVGAKSYKDVEGKSTVITKLYTKYNVAAVFSGHDHLYYRTLRDGVNYIVSAGAGAHIYPLKRAGDAIAGDAYYGRTVENENEFLFHPAKGDDVHFNTAKYFVLSVKVADNNEITFEMIDTDGKIWDTFTFKAKQQ